MQPATLSALAVSGYIVPPPTSDANGDFGRRLSGDSALAKLAKLTGSLARTRAALSEQNERFNALYREAAEIVNAPDELEQLADAVFDNERRIAAKFLPKIEQLKRNLATPGASADTRSMRSWRRSAEEMLEISINWLELYQNLRIRLLKLASDRRQVSDPGSPVFSNAEDADEYLRKLVAE
jgi:hypothetical protein